MIKWRNEGGGGNMLACFNRLLQVQRKGTFHFHLVLQIGHSHVPFFMCQMFVAFDFCN